jgi:transmembrane sensor
MNNVVPLISDDEIFDQASLWLAKIDRTLSEEETTQFRAWYHAQASHKFIFDKLAQTWDRMDEIERLMALFPEPPKVNDNAGYKWHWATAASLFFVSLTFMFLNIWSSNGLTDQEQGQIYATAIGETSIIHLPDNSKVLLNTNSVLRVVYTANYRLLDLQKGELHVDVAHDNNRPLNVVANGQVIQAVGTAFNVQVNKYDVELIVTDGKVVVSEVDKKPDVSQFESLSNVKVAISKGEKISLEIRKPRSVNKLKVVKLDETEINSNLSWRQGKLIFKGETLEQAMSEVSRYTSVKFKIAERSLKDIRIAGRFKTGDVDGLIAALNSNFNIKADRVSDNLVVLRQQH